MVTFWKIRSKTPFNNISQEILEKKKRGVVKPAVTLGGIKCNIFGAKPVRCLQTFLPFENLQLFLLPFAILVLPCAILFCLSQYFFAFCNPFFAFCNFSFASCNHFLPFAALPNIVQLVARCCFKDQLSSRASRNLFAFESIKTKLITRH